MPFTEKKENEKKVRQDHMMKMEQIANEIREFLIERGMWVDTRIYFNNRCYCSCGKSYGNIETKVIEGITPKDYFEYGNEETLAMSFEGSFYDAINYGYHGAYKVWEVYEQFENLLNEHGYYFEFGNAWNLSIFEN